MSQNARILNHLVNGRTITRLEALTIFHIQNITARITELRDAGYVIETEIKTDPNGQDYAAYYMPAYRRAA